MMAAMRLLALAGRHGPALLCGGVLVGIAWPALAAGLRPAMDAAVFCTLGAFLRVDPSALRLEFSRRRAGGLLLALAWATVGVPLFPTGVLAVARPPAELGAAIILCTLAPPIASAAAVAAMLGLGAPLALVVSTVARSPRPS